MGNLSDIHTASQALGGAVAANKEPHAVSASRAGMVHMLDHVASLKNVHQAMRAMGGLMDGQRDQVTVCVRNDDLAALIGIMTDEFGRRVSTLETSIEGAGGAVQC